MQIYTSFQTNNHACTHHSVFYRPDAVPAAQPTAYYIIIIIMKMKDKVKTEYLRWVRRVLQSKLNGGNTIGAINTCAVSLVRYTAGIINWRKDELEAMDRKTRKMMTICNSLHPRPDVDCLCIPGKHSRRGLISAQQSIYMEQQCLSRYIDVSEEELLAATRRENILNYWNGEDNKQLKHRLQQECKEK